MNKGQIPGFHQSDVGASNITQTAELILQTGDVIELSESDVAQIMTWIDKQSFKESEEI